MKKYIVIAALLASTGIFAQQQDSLLRRQMELEREFNPTLQDANKITSLPALREPTVKKANTAYSNWAGRTTPPLEIAMPRPGSIMTDIPYDLKKGYISLNAGNYANIDGALGYRLIENAKQTLGFLFLHNSANGDINYVQESDPSSNKAFFMDNHGQLKYEHAFDAFKLGLLGAYTHSAFNYYGNTFGDTRIYDIENQALGVANVKIDVSSSKSDWLNYAGLLDFRNFTTKYGSVPGENGMKGNQIEAMVGLNKPFEEWNSTVGVDGRYFGVFYNDNSLPGIYNFQLISASPYVGFDGYNWKARLGADVLFQFSNDNAIRVVPNASLSLNVTEKSSLYANIKGGIDDNTYLNTMMESRYIQPMASVKPSFSIVDIEAGAKIGEVPGFRFDIFGGFCKTDDEHFWVLDNHYVDDMLIGTEIWAGWITKEILKPVYGNLSRAHAGAMIQSNIWAPLNIALRVKKNFYTVNNALYRDAQISDAKAYNLPGIETDISADLQAMSNLKFTLSYYFKGDRWSYFKGENVKMTNINDLNLGAIYQINDALSINLKANNLLFQKYDIWYGYPAQGFNAMGGFTFKF